MTIVVCTCNSLTYNYVVVNHPLKIPFLLRKIVKRHVGLQVALAYIVSYH